MKDIHNHILYGMDDGPKSFDESVNLLKDLEVSGVTSIVATPHYIIGSVYESDNKIKRDLINKLQSKTNIKIYIGNEVYIDNNLIEYINLNKISTINGGKYLLIELPIQSKINNLNDILKDLINSGVIPIIAHIERYEYLKIKDIKSIINIGCLLQGDICSLCEKNKYIKRKFIRLLKNNMIYILGTDIHKRVYDINKYLNMIKKIVSDDVLFDDMINNNFDKVVGIYEKN